MPNYLFILLIIVVLGAVVAFVGTVAGLAYLGITSLQLTPQAYGSYMTILVLFVPICIASLLVTVLVFVGDD